MALAGELVKYIGNELVKTGGKSALSSLVPSVASKVGSELATKVGTDLATKTGTATLGSLIPKVATSGSSPEMMTLYRGLTQKYDPNYPIAKLDTSGYESWTDNLDLARQYGDNVYSIQVPKSDIKTSYLDENPKSPTYGDRNPIYSIDKKAGLNGISGNEYLLEVGSPYQKGLIYNEVPSELETAVKNSGVSPEVAKRADSYLGGLMLDKSGKPMTFYHSTPNEFSKFDDARLGENTGYDSAIIENDEGSGGRSVKSYIVFDKNQLSPRYNKDMKFDPNDAKSIWAEAKNRQKDLDTIMKNITDKITADGDKAVYKSGGNKSIESMVNKVERKKSAGRDYRLMDMKDHMRGAVMLENLNNEVDEITSLLENMQYTLGTALDIEAIETDLGYTGLHLTWRDDDGLGYEIQVTTPEIWNTKKASDKIYDEIRNWTTSEIDADPAKRAIYDAKVKESQELWDNLWKKLGGRPDLKYLESFNDDMYYY